jgi:hypothetical protein
LIVYPNPEAVLQRKPIGIIVGHHKVLGTDRIAAKNKGKSQKDKAFLEMD